MTNVVAVVSETEAMIKYEHFDDQNKTKLFVILHGSESKETFELTIFKDKPGEDDISKELDKDEFFKEVDRLYKFIEKDPEYLTHLVTYDLYEIYKAFRKFYGRTTDEDQIFDWESEELLNAFNQKLWEDREREEDPVDIEMDTFLELNWLYKIFNKKTITQSQEC